jgi:hypothetical protein
MTEPGAGLFRTVFEYAALGPHHRTGTPEDAATLDWFEGKLRALGAETERQPWTFDRYDADWALTAGGALIPSLPLFYEGTGDVDVTNPAVVSLRPGGAASLPGLTEAVRAARAAGQPALVITTDVPGGRLFAINRAPGPAPDIPTLLAGQTARERLAGGNVRLRMRAEIVPGNSANVVGRLGRGGDSQRLLLTTPLSGWFRCAGERGTGIAVLLAVAEALAAEGVPLLVTGNSGHELEDLGAHRYLDSGPDCRAVFHFGASVAAGEPARRGGLQLTSALEVRAWVPGREPLLRRIFRRLGKKPVFVAVEAHADPDCWRGESRAWCQLGKPLISMAGGFPLFHTPADLPARATTPALLERSFEVALEACRVLAHLEC